MKFVEKELHLKGCDPQLEERLAKTKCHLRKHQQHKIKGKKIRARMNWLKEGYYGTKYLFNMIRAKHKREMIEYFHINGDVTNDPNSIKDTFFIFDKELFTTKFTKENYSRLEHYLKLMPKKIFYSKARRIDMPLALKEIKVSILSLANEKSPGPDSLPTQFYKHNVEWIVSELLEVGEDAFKFGSLGIDINRGVIKLLPKGWDNSQVKNWRPITLLNIFYKIVSRFLAKRIWNLFNEFISQTQTRFIKGRIILENLIRSWEAMHWARIDDQNVVIVLG